MKKITIGITDCGKFRKYEEWIMNEPGVETIKLGYRDNNFDDIKKCDGIVLTGGEDVHPRFYNKPEYLKYCNPKEIDEKRDDFEWKVLSYSQEAKLPLLGICRGLQLTNVFFGGTLIPDILSFEKSDHAKDHEIDRYHHVQISPGSLLQKIVGKEKGEINSAHHQSADNIATGLIANAVSQDDIIEGLERIEPGGKPFLMLVQWHPERMKNLDSEFSKNIRHSFLQAVRGEIVSGE